jgi:hypothetical protein
LSGEIIISVFFSGKKATDDIETKYLITRIRNRQIRKGGNALMKGAVDPVVLKEIVQRIVA